MKVLLISAILFSFILAGCMLTTTFQTPPGTGEISEETLVSSIVEGQSPESTITTVVDNSLPESDQHGTVLYVSPASTDVTGFISVWFDLKELLKGEVFKGGTVKFYIDILQTREDQATVTMNIYEETSDSTSLTPIATVPLEENEWRTAEGTTTVPDLDNVEKYLLGVRASEPATLDFYIDNFEWEVIYQEEGGAI
ncbi:MULTISPECIES: hypothetical protein [unclassified Thermotoga]|uniref:hypothetical protein n=1 Tax=unclassified Thermotoga TaxID=2631113 RepID=UPI000280EB5B|nr:MULTISPECIES: hypothetical protein [unclassified Thermotoga]AIY86449.1 hypothetical protein T2812B_04530 [Thermotoga sp. 2812B]EJX25890.1 hypothetical protein EMP_05166 [Thermotoga sp. EMP]